MPEAIRSDIRDLLTRGELRQGHRRVEVIEQMTGRRPENQLGSGESIRAIRGDHARIGSGEFSLCLGQHLLPVVVQNELTTFEDCEVAVVGVIRHVALEEHGVVTACAKRADQSTPQNGVAVTPGGADREAENHQFHRDPGRLSRGRYPGRLTSPEQFLDIAFEIDGAVSGRMPGPQMFARPERDLLPLALGDFVEVSEHVT